jgi:hypothetical protein
MAEMLMLALCLLLYSGPLLPLVVMIVLKSTGRIKSWKAFGVLISLLLIQALAFLPYVLGSVQHKTDYLKSLILPLLFGLITLLCGFISVLSAITKARSDPDRPPT